MSRAQAKADVFRAIADPTRRAILDRLRDGPAPVNAHGWESPRGAQRFPNISASCRPWSEPRDFADYKRDTAATGV
jgi:DNA-binding transcriptional ArsR family regulator